VLRPGKSDSNARDLGVIYMLWCWMDMQDLGSSRIHRGVDMMAPDLEDSGVFCGAEEASPKGGAAD
jgi:hypothetical protein